MSGKDAYELVRTSILHRPEAVRREQAQALVETGVDWNTVRKEAARHGVLPSFSQNLEVLFGDRLSASLYDQIQERRQKAQIYAAFLVGELKRIFQLFRENNLPVLTLKGPTLAQNIYGDVAMRRYIDLDLFVPRERLSEANRLLRNVGYEYPSDEQKPTGWRKKLALYLSGQWQLTRKGGALSLDLHTRIMPPGYSFPADFHPFWERSRTVQLRKEEKVRGFAPEDMILILAHHGMKNQWRALKYVADLGGLIRTEPDLDWNVLIERARKTNSTRILRLGLSLTHKVLETSIPADVQRWIHGKPSGDIIALMRTHLRNRHQEPSLPYMKRIQLQLETKDTFASQIGYCVYSAMRHIWAEFLKP